ncbi:RagB/SusD family nutrient uptake outer membrane protein [Cytophagaceae bacterium YF14B1]|uniref:RagB/SusD family nutrient uptake outer membrane protein n=1 Tax=Xanthocytophaga flava TaxID=3048013 RepID=A0AAE3U592_9BACT|nr:RagB/SusD family nutrient uptake outer membrane protein [Xanthocytophaga flavus]MDJ1480031.1 RagB/SusD family nutrient uptake outer membrane protein [Xanthocytophaga flavus]
MRRIFRNKFTYLSIGALFLGSVACKDSFLEVPVTGQVSLDQITSKKGVEGLLIGVYSVMNGRDSGPWHAGASNWLWGSIRGGDANKGTNSGDFSSMNPIENFETEPTNTEVLSKWRGSFEGVARANQVLAILPKVTDVSDADVTRITGEARFLRGHYYFELRKTFKKVPWVDETMDYKTGAETVPNTEEIWANIEADFRYAYENLPETQSEVGRANKWAAGAFLGKVLLYQNKYSEAKTVFDDVIANGQTTNGKKYGLFPSFKGLFRLSNENSQESVFAYQATGAAQNTNNANTDLAMNYPYNTGTSGPGNCCGFFHPSFEMASSFRTNANGLPLLDGSYKTTANELKTDQTVTSSSAFSIDEGNVDPRLDHTIGRRGVPFLDWGPHPGQDWIRDQTYAGPYTPKKYSYSSAESSSLDGSGWTPGYTATNFMIMRFADVLLMAAECEVEVGSLAKALEYVNMIRERASNEAGFVKASDNAEKAFATVSNEAAMLALTEINPKQWVIRSDRNSTFVYLGGERNKLTSWNEYKQPVYKIGLYSSADFATQAQARDRVRFERKLELAMEGQRFFDLVRWDVVEGDITAYFAYETKKIPTHFPAKVEFKKGQDEYLPIPQAEIDLQGKDILKQNDGY